MTRPESLGGNIQVKAGAEGRLGGSVSRMLRCNIYGDLFAGANKKIPVPGNFFLPGKTRHHKGQHLSVQSIEI